MLAQFFHTFGRCDCLPTEVVDRPVLRDVGAVRRDPDVFPRTHLTHMPEKRAVEQRRMEVQILIYRLWIRFARNIWTYQQCFDLAGEDDAPAIVMKIELLDAQGI